MTQVSDSFDCLIFLHIPKNAGSSTHSILGKVYADHETANLFGSKDSDEEISAFISKEKCEKKGIKLLKGHMPFGMHNYIEQSSKYFTLIREPVGRLISQYNYILRHDHNPHYTQIVNEKLSIADIIERGIVRGFDNAQCRFLTNQFDIPFNSLPEDTLEVAANNLNKHFLFSGLTDRFDLSMLILSKLLGWKKLPYYRRENTHKKKGNDYKVTTRDIDLIESQNAMDLALYQLTKKKFEHVVEQIPGMQKELELYQKNNAWYQRLTYPLSLF